MGVADNIIKTEHDRYDKSLKLYYKHDLDRKCVMNVIKYLNNTDWKNYKFNQYSVKKNGEGFVITLNYIVPKIK